ncbi:MAG: UDP-2,4-diacetamido-2,4,6-trideoxy-beta-L-altropyranose hydrolase [Verrucomicrobia bacterium]|nr:UDP-2,4-diacetamido-2,4,6-trideoxy-beta-L-altropyranose hydrolase [Verrucomicrobiota bacterium]
MSAGKKQECSIIIRADASTRLGTGHVMRCIALAQACQKRNISIAFACVECPGGVRQRIHDEGSSYHRLIGEPGSKADSDELLKLAGRVRCSHIVLDGYHFDNSYHHRLRAAGYKVLVIDDYGHLKKYEADVLLNQNIYASEELYPCINPDCHLLLGTKYVLLRSEFLHWRGHERQTPEKAANILVIMGGSDPEAVTLKILDALHRLEDNSLLVRVIIGSANPNKLEIIESAQCLPMKCEVIEDARNMPEQLAWADIAVSAAGSTCWELIFMRVPTLVVSIAENQNGIARSLISRELMAGLPLDDTEISSTADAIGNLINSPGKRTALKERCRAEIDGLGAERVCDCLMPVHTTIRPAHLDDCRMIWEWANDPLTRSMSFTSREIPYLEHERWFVQQLEDTDKILFIAEANCVPAGFIRFDNQGKETLISLNIAPEFRGRGLAVRFLTQAVTAFIHDTGIVHINAFIKPDNKASIKTFERAGFRMINETIINGIPGLHYHFKTDQSE